MTGYYSVLSLSSRFFLKTVAGVLGFSYCKQNKKIIFNIYSYLILLIIYN